MPKMVLRPQLQRRLDHATSRTGVVVLIAVVLASYGSSGIHALDINVMKSSSDTATAKFMQGFTTYTDNAAFLAAAGPSEWCVGFNSYTVDVEFQTTAVLVRADVSVTPNFQPFTIGQIPRSTTGTQFFNTIKTGSNGINRADLFVNDNGGAAGELVVETSYTIPVASWRAVFQAIEIDPQPSEGVKISITLQTSDVVLSISNVANGFFGFTVSPNTKVEKIIFAGTENLGVGGEGFEMDDICGSASRLTPVVPTPGPVQPPRPTSSPTPEDDDECFAAAIPIIGLLICFLLELLSGFT